MGLREHFRGVAAGALLAALGALPVAAAPLTLWIQPNGGFGFDAASTTAALGAGVALLPDSSFLTNPGSGPPHVTITTPSPISGTSRQNATFANPSTGTSTWTVTAQDRAYNDLWIVIQGHDPNDAYASYYDQNHKIGLVIDPANPNWAVVHPSGSPAVTYLAYFVGDLAQGASSSVPISYAVAKALKLVQGSPRTYWFPQYRASFLELTVVPEPVELSLLVLGGTLLAIRKRRTER
ncbi:MAG TPA: PEP-CTERM sorting domain-containing protein [Myxococcota bacterium]|jgi:hypothetical protein